MHKRDAESPSEREETKRESTMSNQEQTCSLSLTRESIRDEGRQFIRRQDEREKDPERDALSSTSVRLTE